MKDNVINIPGSLSKLSFGDYIKLLKLIEDNQENEQMMNDRIVQFFTGDMLKDVRKMKSADYDLILSTVLKCFQEKPSLTMITEIKGKAFGFIPKLDDLTVGEYIDLDYNLKSKEDWPRAMAILYRPIVETKKKTFWSSTHDKYDIEEYESSEKYAELMNDLPADIGLGAVLFFWTLSKDLLTATLHYMENQLKAEKQAQKREALEKGMDGIKEFIQRLEDNTFKWMPL